MSRNSREFKELMARLEKTTAQGSFHHSALVAVYEGLLDFFPNAEMLWRRPIEQSARDVIDCTETEATAKDEPPEDNTTNTDDTSKDGTSEVDMCCVINDQHCQHEQTSQRSSQPFRRNEGQK